MFVCMYDAVAFYGSIAQVSRSNHLFAGTFGRVLECWDRKNKDYVAIKIVRNVQKYRDAAMIEVWHRGPQPASWTFSCPGNAPQ